MKGYSAERNRNWLQTVSVDIKTAIVGLPNRFTGDGENVFELCDQTSHLVVLSFRQMFKFVSACCIKFIFSCFPSLLLRSAI